ncbi:hypothetical protein RvY_19066 [Ramazzottius varieornatus]|uniref:Uncharacterized protein n=1 Tax=Ramazzottius varieornatus TaxID=947166 RepID=A0A1D1W844_RAMVA|nr:hypothetical protein RvY_19066 [Ramazzottius varieornatus]
MVQKSWRNFFCELRGSLQMVQMVQLLSEYVHSTVEFRAEEESSHKDDHTSQRCQNLNRAVEDVSVPAGLLEGLEEEEEGQVLLVRD